jgi:hypothetical protein
MSPGQVHKQACRLQTGDRLAVKRLRCFPSIKECPRARFDAQCPRGAAGARRFAQQLKGLCGALASTAAAGGFDQLDRRKGREPQLMWIRGRLRGRGERILVACQAVIECGGHPVLHRESHPLAARDEVLRAGSDQLRDLTLTATKSGQREGPVRRDDATVGRLGECVRLLDQRRGLWVPVIRSPHATCAYSWISPPSRSRRTTLPTDTTTAASLDPSGGACPKARCGRCTLGGTGSAAGRWSSCESCRSQQRMPPLPWAVLEAPSASCRQRNRAVDQPHERVVQGARRRAPCPASGRQTGVRWLSP